MAERHGLTEKDKSALTAACSVCGPDTKIRRVGRYGYACVNARRQSSRRYVQAHPERVKLTKARPPSAHRLTNRDGSTDVCAICGPVTPVAWGRGWCCPIRAKELGRHEFPAAPTPKCPDCASVYLTHDSRCAACGDRESWDVAFALQAMDYRFDKNGSDLALTSFMEHDHDGFMIVGGDTTLPSFESAVKGWKTLGSPEPVSPVKPEYARLYGRGC